MRCSITSAVPEFWRAIFWTTRPGCASACRPVRKSGNACRLRWMPSATTARLSLMSANSIPQVEGAGAAQRSASFDPAFRARLRELLIWRRDVRRFRRDPLPSGALDALIELACLAPSVGLSQPWRFVIVEDGATRAAIRENFATCNAQALAAQSAERSSLYARLKLAGLDEAPAHFAVFADHATAQG